MYHSMSDFSYKFLNLKKGKAERKLTDHRDTPRNKEPEFRTLFLYVVK